MNRTGTDQNVGGARQFPSRWLRSEYTVEVSIVIVNYNTRAMLQRTLESIFASQHECGREVIVIDNASRDGSPQMVRDRFPQVSCVENAENLGHSRGCNQGMALAKGRYLFLLNSDTIMLSGAMDALVEYLDEHPRVGAVASQVLNVDGTVQGTIKRFPTPMSALFGRYSIITRLLPRNRFSRRYLVYLDQDLSKPFAVDSASAAALMVRREAIDRAGLLDERFFLYWNDVDWCRSIWESGFEVHYVPASVLKHDEHHGGTRGGARQRLKTILNFHRGAYIYYRKWQPRRFWYPSRLVAILGLSLRAAIVICTEPLRWLGTPRKL